MTGANFKRIADILNISIRRTSQADIEKIRQYFKEEKIADRIVNTFLDNARVGDHQKVIDGAVIGDVADDGYYYTEAWEYVTGTEYTADGSGEESLGISLNVSINMAHTILRRITAAQPIQLNCPHQTQVCKLSFCRGCDLRERQMVNFLTGDIHTKSEWLDMFGDDLVHVDGWTIMPIDGVFLVDVEGTSHSANTLQEAQELFWRVLYTKEA